MSEQALDKISNALKQLQAEGKFTAKVIAEYNDLAIEIKDFGALKLPIKPGRAKALIKKARPAKYGLVHKGDAILLFELIDLITIIFYIKGID